MMVGTEPRVDHRRVVNWGGLERLGWVGILVNSGVPNLGQGCLERQIGQEN